MRAFLAAAAIIVAVGFFSPAGAAHRNHHHHTHRVSGMHRHVYASHHAGGIDYRPTAWCGWYLRQILHVSDRAFNRALAWMHWGHSSDPQIGAVAIWSHGGGHGHVALIRGSPDVRGRWLIEDGNDGPQRIHRRSLAGAIAFRAP